MYLSFYCNCNINMQYLKKRTSLLCCLMQFTQNIFKLRGECKRGGELECEQHGNEMCVAEGELEVRLYS